MPDSTDGLINIIGLNSGTSADGLDMALIRFDRHGVSQILQYETVEYSTELRQRIIDLGEADFTNGIEWMKLDAQLGVLMGGLTKKFIDKLSRDGYKADLIGSHGQTIRHLPAQFKYPLTLQIGDAAYIAAATGLPVVSDFRKSDLTHGGQGAPLSPVLHEKLFRHPDQWRVIVNIGGISNATILPPQSSGQNPVAADCGPGNMVVDLATIILFGKPYDEDGHIAFSGKAASQAVHKALDDPYFKMPPPKSTGREHFGHDFFEGIIRALKGATTEDVIATLSEITVASIADFIQNFAGRVDEIYLCGGGAKNLYFKKRLQEYFPSGLVAITDDLGFSIDYLEATLWAYMAYCFINRQTVDAAHFTGASKPYIPGKLTLP